jgi:hypothetical protein
MSLSAITSSAKRIAAEIFYFKRRYVNVINWGLALKPSVDLYN